jgi:hypothetical protein
MLNDSFVRQQSQALANRLLRRTDLDDSGRVHAAYRLSLNRTATTKEVERAQRYLVEYEAALRDVKKSSSTQASEAAEATTAAWASFCQALLASAEFRYVR